MWELRTLLKWRGGASTSHSVVGRRFGIFMATASGTMTINRSLPILPATRPQLGTVWGGCSTGLADCAH